MFFTLDFFNSFIFRQNKNFFCLDNDDQWKIEIGVKNKKWDAK